MALISTVIGRGVFGSRPSAGHAGYLYYATDYGIMYRDNGSTWDALLDITSLTADASPDSAADYVVTWDNSASKLKKVLLSNLPSGGSSGITMISEQTPVSGSSASFTSIANTYRHLRLVVSARSDVAATDTGLTIQFNNDTSGNYRQQALNVVNTTVSASRSTGQTAIAAGYAAGASASAGITNQTIIDIPYYAAGQAKMAICNCAYSTGTSNMEVYQRWGAWDNTAAISRVDVLIAGGAFVTPSKISLYGIT